MGLLSIFSRNSAAAAPPSGDAVEQARTRARRRLIGAVVLVGIGVVGFPLLFETAPRPVPVDVPIEIPRKDAVPPLSLPPPSPGRAASGTVQAPREPLPEPTREAASPLPAPPASAVVTAPPPKSPASASAPTVAATAPRSSAPTARQPAKPAPLPSPAADAAGRIVVQVGAYADAKTARDVRQRVEKLGLKTHTQVVDTEAGQRVRVRVGPFASREQADQAAGRLKSAGLPAAVLAL